MLHQLVATALLAFSGSDGPFAELGYDAALAQAKAKSKLLFVDFTASWCPPCKRMEAEVWPHADVRAWLGEHAIAIQVDVDEEPELAKRFEIQAMPTIVALREGAEFDRVVGYKDVPAFLAWAKDVAAGKRSSDALMERAKALAQSEDVDARYDLAQDLARAKQYDLALEHYLWVWPASRKVPAMRGVRLSFLLSSMAELAKKHPPARKAFLDLLEQLQLKVDAAGVPAFDDWSEWTSMAQYLGQPERMIAWYEKRRDEAGRLFPDAPGAVPLEGFAPSRVRDPHGDEPGAREPVRALLEPDDAAQEHILADVFEVLMKADRAQDAVRLYADARARARRIVERYEMFAASAADFEEPMRTEMQTHSVRQVQNDIAELYVALLKAGRAEEAGDVGALLIRTLDTPDSRLALVRAGLAVERADANLVRWLDEAEKAGANVRVLRRRLERVSAAGDAASGGK